ncbi:hypothetical protein RHMOL_Rhmol02G0053900 [Rhododendron molle]|uniref:Uncharacterized protein n=1 Tax=Rhododendron molle TaxID=49168 RepID=A0ACC0PP86_RHOML|nr:hypothetical protein RHMOL_Rhmol02G0053900 [Rhododendron molle]
MGSTSKSRKLSEEMKLNEAEDRISNLPKDIMVCILSLLPTKYAVATSILSTKWKRMWTSITDLDIEFLDSKGHGSRCEKNFIKFFHHVLLSLDGSNLDGFRVSCKGVSPYFKASHVKSWVMTAVSCNVRQLGIYIPPLLASRWLPDDLFTCQTLVVLKLGYCFFLPVPSLVRLQNLKTLLLHSAVFRDGDSAYRLISGCPVLEDLSLIKCGGRGFRLLKISAPLLKRLVISYPLPECYRPHDVLYDVSSDEYKIELITPSLVSFKYSGLVAEGYGIDTLSSLVKARLHFELCGEDTLMTSETQDADTFGTPITKLLQGISNVQTLRISGNSIETLELYSYDIMEEPDEDDFELCFEFEMHQFLKLPTFRNLTWLELGVNSRVRWVLLPYLLESSPNLTSLVFVEGLLHYDRYSDPDNWDWHPPENVPACLLFSLEILDVRKFQGQQRELKIVKYLLSNAKSLKTLSVRCEKRKMKREMLEVRRELMETPRGSRICEVVVS